MKALSEFATEAEARAYEQFHPINSNKAEHFFSVTGAIVGIELHKDSGVAVEVVTGLPTTIGALCKSVLSTLAKSNGSFELDPKHPDGIANRDAMNKLVENGVIIQTIADEFIKRATHYPYKNATQAEIDASKLTIDKQEVVYPSETYLILTSSNDKVVVTVNCESTDENLNFNVYGYWCSQDKDQNDWANYTEFQMPLTNIKNGELANFEKDITNTKRMIENGARYFRFKVEPNKAVVFDASVR